GWLKPQVPCHVRPLVVFARAKVRAGVSVNGVRVISLSSLTSAIMGRAPSVSAEDVRRYANCLGGIGATMAARSGRRSKGPGERVGVL
ncbi:MAG TPA: hypothetical protein VN478_01640, partial [Clostridia bacterium]|nr:hypothetical protein [Clostridia bacterium]